MVKVVPWPGSLAGTMVAWWLSRMALQMARPRPAEPAGLERLASPRKKRRKRRGKSSAGMPWPVSRTVSSTLVPEGLIAT